MKKLFLSIVLTIALFTATFYLIGMEQYEEVSRVITAKMASVPGYGSDLDIASELHAHGFNLDWSDVPTAGDFIAAGFNSFIR